MASSLKQAEIVAWCLGLVCASTLAFRKVEAVSVGQTAKAFGAAKPAEVLPVSWAPTSKTKPITHPDQVMGRLDIPSLSLSTPIVDNSDDESLMLGAGHVRGTAMPGGLGNFVIAAHRDTYFRPLAAIHPGMKMQVVTSEETYTYIVDSTEIVLPSDVDVLDMGDIPQMTLITCYPFHYIGSAPKRFVVRAHLQGF